MSDDSKKGDTPDKPAEKPAGWDTPPDAQDAENDNAEATPGTPGDPPAGPEMPDPVEQLVQENDELKDRMLRTMAEMENLRRRTEREKLDATKYAITQFAQDMLGVGDNLARALNSVSSDEQSGEDVIKNLIEGIEMTEREMLNVFERHGIARVEPAGEKFDPNLHQAMFELENAEVEAGTVVKVIQAGYTIGERILRPAMVGIAKGGARPAAKTAQTAPAGPKTDPAADTAGDAAASTPTDGTGPSKPAQDPADLGKKIDKSA